jgi:hypothetical protein
MQTPLSSRASAFRAARDPGEPRETSQPALRERKRPKGSLRRINRAFGSLPYLTSPAPSALPQALLAWQTSRRPLEHSA